MQPLSMLGAQLPPLKPVALGLVAAAAALVCSASVAAPTPARAAYCVAALKARAEPLAERLRAGETQVEPQLLPIVRNSFAFIGTTYKQGVRSAEADELLKAAEIQQADLPQDELVKVQDICNAQGRELFESANAFERMFVARAARARIDKLKRKKR